MTATTASGPIATKPADVSAPNKSEAQHQPAVVACETCEVTADAPDSGSVLNHAAKRYLASFMVLIAIAVGGVALLDSPVLSTERTLLAVVMALVCGIAWTIPLNFGPRSQVQLETAVVIASLLLFPVAVVCLITGIGPLLANLRLRGPWREAGFNSAQGALQAMVGGALLTLLGWQMNAPDFSFPHPLPIIFLIGAVLHLINTVAVAGIIALQDQTPFWRSWKMLALSYSRVEILAHLAQFGIGVLAAAIVTVEPWMIALLLLPGAAVYGALGHHTRLRLRAEERLVRQAYHDALTDLPNRVHFADKLTTTLSTLEPGSETVSVLFLDLDRFKLINDTLGHQAGDQLLVTVAGRLRDEVPTTDLVARFGGDEFTILLTDLGDPRQAEEIAQRIIKTVTSPIRLGTSDVIVTTSIGIAYPIAGKTNTEDLLRAADVALYQAKAAGRDRFAVYDEAVAAATENRLALENDLRLAIGRGEINVVYQPKLELATNEIAEVEALIRWDHPKWGSIATETFLPVAEETGLILPLGQWVLERACRTARTWHGQRSDNAPAISFNVSARQLRDGDFVAEVARALDASGLPASGLRIEIAEGMAMDDLEGTIQILDDLRALGVGVTIDNFVSGAFSLGALPQLPIDAIQLDRSFVAELGRSSGASTIARAIIGLAHGLGLRVIAGGVESAEQSTQLQEWECDLVQGSHIFRPIPEDQISDFLVEHQQHATEPQPNATVLTKSYPLDQLVDGTFGNRMVAAR